MKHETFFEKLDVPQEHLHVARKRIDLLAVHPRKVEHAAADLFVEIDFQHDMIRFAHDRVAVLVDDPLDVFHVRHLRNRAGLAASRVVDDHPQAHARRRREAHVARVDFGMAQPVDDAVTEHIVVRAGNEQHAAAQPRHVLRHVAAHAAMHQLDFAHVAARGIVMRVGEAFDIDENGADHGDGFLCAHA